MKVANLYIATVFTKGYNNKKYSLVKKYNRTLIFKDVKTGSNILGNIDMVSSGEEYVANFWPFFGLLDNHNKRYIRKKKAISIFDNAYCRED